MRPRRAVHVLLVGHARPRSVCCYGLKLQRGSLFVRWAVWRGAGCWCCWGGGRRARASQLVSADRVVGRRSSSWGQTDPAGVSVSVVDLRVLRMVGCRQAVPCTRFLFSRAAQILRRAGEMDSPFESPVLCSPSFRTVFAIC